MTDNDVVVRLLVRDDGSVELKKFQAQVAATKAEVSGLGGEGNALGRLFDSLDGKTNNLSTQLLGLNRNLASSSTTLRHGLIFGIRDLTLGLGAATAAVDYFGLKAVDSFQHSQAAFATLTGSVANGKKMYQQLLDLNLQSPLNMQPLAAGAQTLLGFGLSSPQSLAVLRNLSNVAAVQQDPNAALDRMSLAVGQINQSGVVRAQDLNQLVQAGLPAYSLIPGGHQALAAGHTISSQQFMNAMMDPNNPSLARYGGAAHAMNQTLSGQLSNMTTELQQTLIHAFHPAARQLVAGMPGLTSSLQGDLRTLAPDMAAFGLDVVHGAEKILPVLVPIVKSLLSGIDQLAKSGGPFLRELQNVDPQVTSALDNLFMTLAAEEPALAGIFGDLLQVLPLFITDLADLLQLADPLLKMLDTFLGFKPVAHIMGGLLVGLLAYKTLAGPIEMVLKMTTAIKGLTIAEAENAIVSKETGGIGGGGMGGGGLPGIGKLMSGKNMTTLLGAGLSLSAIKDSLNGKWGTGDDLSIIGGGAMIGSRFGPWGAGVGAVSGGLFDAFGRLHRHYEKNPDPGVTSIAVAPVNSAWFANAATHDQALRSLVAKSGGSFNIQAGAITVHAAPGMDEAKLAKAINNELNNWLADRAARR